MYLKTESGQSINDKIGLGRDKRDRRSKGNQELGC